MSVNETKLPNTLTDGSEFPTRHEFWKHASIPGFTDPTTLTSADPVMAVEQIDMILLAMDRAKQPKDAPWYEKIAALHRPYAIYGECDHDHDSNDELGVVDIDEIGLTCNKVYDICAECCTNGVGEQSVDCADSHKHSPNEPICKTVALLNG